MTAIVEPRAVSPDPDSQPAGQPTLPPRSRPRLALGAWLLAMLVCAGVTPDLQSVLGLSSDVVPLIMFAPAVAAAVALPLCRQASVRGAWHAVAARDLGLTLIGTGVAVAAFLAALFVLTGNTPSLPASIGGLPLAVALLVQLLGALGEEVGWRGFVQRTAEHLAGPWAVLLGAGVLFGATHLGYWARGPLFVACFTASSVAMVASIGLLWRGSVVQRLIPATLVHFAVNAGLDAFRAGSTDASVWMIPAPTLVMLAAAALFRLAVGRRWASQTR